MKIESMKTEFFRFRSAHKKGVYRIKPLAKYDTLNFLDEKCPLIVCNEFVIESGTKKFDILPFFDSRNFAISKNLKEILEQNEVSGWSSFEIKIKGIEDKYFAFQNLSMAGSITNLDAVNNNEADICEFDITTWDGSDIFHLDETALNICTERIKLLLESKKLTNIEINPL